MLQNCSGRSDDLLGDKFGADSRVTILISELEDETICVPIIEGDTWKSAFASCSPLRNRSFTHVTIGNENIPASDVIKAQHFFDIVSTPQILTFIIFTRASVFNCEAACHVLSLSTPMIPVADEPCTLLLKPRAEPFDVNECRKALESGTETAKIDAMIGLLHAMADGEPCGSLVMHVIRFVMPNQKNKFLKKLVLYFFELCPKVDAEGKLLQEMILLCNALRSDLQHPNEYVRGVTLRFVCKLTEPELLEPLIPVEHTHPYVRRNAIFAVWSVWERHPVLLPDGPELVEQVLAVESDAGCQRNAFVMLAHTEPYRAAAFLEGIMGRLEGLDSALQLAVVQFMLADASGANEGRRSVYVRALGSLLASPAVPSMVKYEACGAMMALTAAPAAIKSVAAAYVEMALKEADNNVKLVVLDRLAELQAAQAAIVNEGVLDVLRVLSTSDAEIRRRALKIVLAGVNARVAGDLVSFLGKELARASSDDEEYVAKLLQAVHECATRFPATAPAALGLYAEALEHAAANANGECLREVPSYAKALLVLHEELRGSFVDRLAAALPSIGGGPALAQALLWLVAEYSMGPANAQAVLGAVRLCLAEEGALEDRSAGPSTKVLADGTYVTEAAPSGTRSRSAGGLGKLLADGHHGVAASIALALTKLVLRFAADDARTRAEAALLCTQLLRRGLANAVPLDPDTFERILLCVRVLGGAESPVLAKVLEARQIREASSRTSLGHEARSKPSAPLSFRLLKTNPSNDSKCTSLTETEDLARLVAEPNGGSRAHSVLSRVVQLTGFSDPIYAETYVLVRGGDVLLDVLLVNQTAKTLPSVTIDLATVGELKVVEKPPALTLPPHGFAAVKAALRVASAGSALLHGALSFGDVEPRAVVLAPVSLDLADFMESPPPHLDETDFRRAWPLLEWENKIVIGPIKLAPSSGDDQILSALLARLLASIGGGLACITPGYGLAEGGAYLAANMHARSVFAEEVLGNICLERSSTAEGLVIAGHARLRSRSQGIAVALGDKISLFFKSL